MARFNTGDSYTLNQIRASRVNVYNIPGSNTWTVPSNVSCATFEVWGAGGGGGAKCCCDCYHQGAGGSSGNYAAITIPVNSGQTYTLCIGAGGMYVQSGNSAQHSCCQGGAGGFSSVSGGNITTLCAGGGTAGINMCYTYCLCTDCSPRATFCACAIGTGAASCAVGIGSATSTGSTYTNIGGQYVGQWTDSSGNAYKSVAAGVAWGSSTVNTINWCCAPSTNGACFAQAGCSMGGQAGQGAFLGTCCYCITAGTGSNGLILIRY